MSSASASTSGVIPRDDHAAESDPARQPARILLLLDQRENRALLARELSQRYELLQAETDAALDDPFDLCILDGRALDRLWEQVRERKEAAQPSFLPVLLVTAQPGVKMITRHLWRAVDELIVTPIQKAELSARLEVLLRARSLSLQLHRRDEESRAMAERLRSQADALEAQTVQLEAQARDLRSTTQQLADRTEAAETANRAKSEFLAAMSHELRTPLNAIAGYLDLLEMGAYGPLSEEQSRALERIALNGRHLLTLIQDVLSFARLEAGHVEYDIRVVPGGELVGSLEPIIAPLAQAKGITLSGLDCDPAIQVVADPERARQILLNLISNAIKFVPTDGWIRLDCEKADREALFSIRDNGPGIPAEKQEAIFDPFVQVERRLNRPQDGVGLGLAISRNLARGMNGDLRVDSSPGQGSTFTLALPLAEP